MRSGSNESLTCFTNQTFHKRGVTNLVWGERVFDLLYRPDLSVQVPRLEVMRPLPLASGDSCRTVQRQMERLVRIMLLFMFLQGLYGEVNTVACSEFSVLSSNHISADSERTHLRIEATLPFTSYCLWILHACIQRAGRNYFK